MSATEIFTNQPFGTVTSGGTDISSTTWTVSSNPAAPFPAAATGVSQFHVTDTNATAASEIITVTNVSGSTWTVVRGAEGTTPVVHEANFTITQVLTAGWLSGVNSGVNPVGNGGTGIVTAAAYALLAGGTASTTPFQQVAGLGTSGQVLTSQGAGSLPSWTSQTGLVNPMSALGDMISGGTAGTAVRLAGGTIASKKFLTQTGAGTISAAPQWGTIAASDVPVLNQNTTGSAGSLATTLGITGGGTGQITAPAAYNALSPMTTTGDIEYESANGVASRLGGNTGAAKNFLISTGSGGTATPPAWGTIASADVPVLNQNTTGTAANVTGTVATINGGTGLGSLTTYGIVAGGTASTTPVQQIAAGTSGQVLTGNGAGTLPSFQAIPTLNQNTTGTAANVTGTVATINGGTGLGSVTAYAVVTGGTSSTTALQTVSGVGTSSQVLTSNGAGSLPSFQAIPAGTTSAAGILQLDGTATDIQSPGTQSAGSGSLAALATHVHPLTGFYPADAGFLEWNFDSGAITTNTALTTSGNVYLMRVNVRAARSVSNVVAYFGAVGSTLTTSQNFAGLYSSAGSLIGTSADQTVNWNTGGTTGLQTLSVGGTFSVPTGFVWVALMFHGTTGPAFGRASSNQAASANIGYTASTARHAAATGGTVLPGTINTTNNALQAVEYWAAIS